MTDTSTAEKGKAAASPSSPSLRPRPILPAPGSNSKGEPATGNGKAVASQGEKEGNQQQHCQQGTQTQQAPLLTPQTINQQLATHLALANQMSVASAAIKLPPPKRKRGSLDSPLTGFKMKHSMHAADSEASRRIGFIGAGNMARAIVEGWIAGGMRM